MKMNHEFQTLHTMKKHFLLATVLFCLVAVASAQQSRQETSLSERIDSITNPYEKTALVYDQKLRCYRMYYYINENDPSVYYTVGPAWAEKYSLRFSYDIFDNISTIYIDQHDLSDVHFKIVRRYAEHLYEEDLYGKLYGLDWNLASKTRYEYDAHDKCTALYFYSIHEEIGEEVEEELYRQIYTYQDGLLINMTRLEGEALTPTYCVEYSYNEDRNLLQELESNITSEGTQPFAKTVLVYDSHHNPMEIHQYEFNGDWERKERTVILYDWSDPAEKVAGYNMVISNDPLYFSPNAILLQGYNLPVSTTLFHFENKLLTARIYNKNGSYLQEYHHSFITSLDESTETPVKVGPNPVADLLTIQGDEVEQVEICSLDGRGLMHLTQEFESVNVNALASGSYLVVITLKDGRVVTQPIIKQ